MSTPSDNSVPTPAIRAEGLTLRVGNRALLQDSSFEVAAGELCLMVGASGTGKSLTLSVLAGLLGQRPGIQVHGAVYMEGRRRRRPARRGSQESVSVVFQDFALLDDLDTRNNVVFAQQHGRLAAQGTKVSDELLDELGLPHKQRTAELSGGMKQRLALARALAFGPRILFHDEPTSGLDPAMSRRIAQRIREAHDQHRMTTVIVTHDLEALRGIADRIMLLDPQGKRWRTVDDGEVDQALEQLRSGPTPTQRAPVLQKPVPRSVRSLAHIGDFVMACGRTAIALVPRPPRLRWGLHFFWHFLRLTSVGSAMPFMALAGFIGGFIATYFLFGLLPFRGYTEPVLSEEFVGALGFAMYRVLTPSLVILLFAARSGAAIAADIGNRVLTRQFDAMNSFGIKPERYLLSAAVLASLVGTPLLFLLAEGCGRIAALAVYLTQHPGHGALSFDAEFHRLLAGSSWFPEGSWWNVAKLLICAVGTAGIAYHTGRSAKHSGADVARAVTNVIIRATIFALIVMTLMAPFEFAQQSAP